MKFNVNGLVLGKEFKEASESFTDKNGKVVSAQPDRYVLSIVFGDKEGELFKGVTVVKNVKVDEKTFNSITKLLPVNITVDMYNSLDNYKTKIVKVSEFAIYE